MPTLHLIPVGRSLLDEIELSDATITVREAMQGALGVPRKLDWEQLARAGVARPAATAGTDLAAEWTSVAAINREPHAVACGDAFVFIATDTDPGLAAAAMLATRYERSGVHYLHQPLASRHPPLAPGDVYICRIPDLDMGERSPTRVTWRSLGAVGRLAVDTAKQTDRGPWRVIVHLNGGYKAMIPYLMMMAESVNSLLRDVAPGEPRRPALRVVAIHESSSHIIDIPVRAIEGDLLRDVEKLAKLVRPDNDNDSHSDVVSDDASGYLLGLFVEAGQLTTAGLIMVNVL